MCRLLESSTGNMQVACMDDQFYKFWTADTAKVNTNTNNGHSGRTPTAATPPALYASWPPRSGPFRLCSRVNDSPTFWISDRLLRGILFHEFGLAERGRRPLLPAVACFNPSPSSPAPLGPTAAHLLVHASRSGGGGEWSIVRTACI